MMIDQTYKEISPFFYATSTIKNVKKYSAFSNHVLLKA